MLSSPGGGLGLEMDDCTVTQWINDDVINQEIMLKYLEAVARTEDETASLKEERLFHKLCL